MKPLLLITSIASLAFSANLAAETATQNNATLGSAEQQHQPGQPEQLDQQLIIEMFSAHYDIARLMHSFSAEQLSTQKVAMRVPSDQYELSYKIDFDQPHMDAYGNEYRGEIMYQKTHENHQEGDIEYMKFNDFYINDIRVSGAKISRTTSVINKEVRGSCWTSSDRYASNSVSPQQPQLFTMHLPDGRSVGFDGELNKQVTYDISGQKKILIDGTATVYLGDESYHFTVEQPLEMSMTCRWLQAGTVAIKDSNNQALGTLDLTDESRACSSQYQVILANNSTQKFSRQHQFWK